MAKQRIVIVGGGFGGLRALHRLHRSLGDRAEITLVDGRSTSLARPMLPEVAFAGRPVEHARFPLDGTVRRNGATFVEAMVEQVDAQRNEVVIAGDKRLPYDYLLLAVGAVKNFDATPGFREYGYSPCDDQQAPRLWEAVERFSGGPVVIGSAKSTWGTRVPAPHLDAPCEGPVGEAMFMLDHELRRRQLRERSSITVFSPSKVFFEDVGDTVHAAVVPLLERQQIAVQTSKEISRIASDHVEFADGTQLESALTILLPVYSGQPLVARSGLGDEKGFVPTDQTMRHVDYANIYAAGDGTALAMPKLGHLAVKQADVAAAAIARAITGAGDIPPIGPEIFCIMNQGGRDAILIHSDTFFGGTTDLAFASPFAHLLKWTFDVYYTYTRGHLPPDASRDALNMILERLPRTARQTTP